MGEGITSGFAFRMSRFDIVPVSAKNTSNHFARVGTCSECEDTVKIDPNDAAGPHRDHYGDACSGNYRQVETVFFVCPTCSFSAASYYVYGKSILAHRRSDTESRRWCRAGGMYVKLSTSRRVVDIIHG
jgi:hypothetical protein